jgi:hypothetical protein
MAARKKWGTLSHTPCRPHDEPYVTTPRRSICRLAASAAALLASLLFAPRAASAGWSDAQPQVARDLQRGKPLVVHVVVPLCHSGQIVCGEHGLGSPKNLRTNLYWGAMFGAKRFFERRHSGWQAVSRRRDVDGVLERAVYRKRQPGAAWGMPGTIEQLVVLDAIDGDRIDDAVKRFWHGATGGRWLRLSATRWPKLRVHVTGYAGHNRLMDGVKLGRRRHSRIGPTSSFVLACDSESYFGDALRDAGSTPLLTTQAFMAPEGYTVEAMANALGRNLAPGAIRSAVVASYARWQRISQAQASRIFAPSDAASRSGSSPEATAR